DGIRDDLVTGVQTCALPISHGLLPGQSNIDQGSVCGQQFEINAPERTLAFYAQEEFLTLQERLLLSAGFRAERSSSNGNTNKYRSEERRVGTEMRSSGHA